MKAAAAAVGGFVACLVAGSTALAFAGGGVKSVTVDAARLFPMLGAYFNLPESDRSGFQLIYRFRLQGSDQPPPIKLFYLRGSDQTPVTVNAEGWIEQLPTREDIKARTRMLMQGPEGLKVMEDINVISTLPPRPQYAAAELSAGLDQVNRSAHRAAGLMSFVVPHFSKAIFVGAGSGTAVTPDGHAIPLPMSKDGPAFDPARLANARAIWLTHPPARVVYGTDKD